MGKPAKPAKAAKPAASAATAEEAPSKTSKVAGKAANLVEEVVAPVAKAVRKRKPAAKAARPAAAVSAEAPAVSVFPRLRQVRKVLVLAYYFPPHGGAGVQRTVKFLKHLPSVGYKPVVVTGPDTTVLGWAPPDETLADEIPPSTEVHRVPGPEPTTAGRWRGRAERWLGVRGPFAAWWAESTTTAGLELARDVDVVYASMSPFETALAAARISAALGKPWVADLRDPWALDEWTRYPTRLHRAWDARRMGEALETSSAVVLNTPEAESAIRERFPDLADRLATIPNGWDEDDFALPAPPPAGDRNFRIAHVGYAHGAPVGGALAGTLRRLLGGRRRDWSRRPAPPAICSRRCDVSVPNRVDPAIQVHLAGPGAHLVGEDAGRVVDHGYVSHADAVALLRALRPPVPADARSSPRGSLADGSRKDVRVPRIRHPDPRRASRGRRPRSPGRPAERLGVRAARRGVHVQGDSSRNRRDERSPVDPGCRARIRAEAIDSASRRRPRPCCRVGASSGAQLAGAAAMSSDDGSRDLREATLTGVRWVTGARLVAEVTAFVSVVALARLIPPAEFGHAAVALVVVGVAAILGPRGLTAVVVQRSSISRSEIETVAFLCLVVGIGLSLATFVFAVAGPGEALFGARTAELLALSSPAFVLVGIGGVPQALMQRELGFRRVGVFDAASVVLGAVSSVALAFSGYDGVALVLGALALVGSLSLMALVSVTFVPPRLSRAGTRELAGFATPVTLSSLVYLGFRHVDYAILGARMPAAQVGFYWRAYQLGVEYQGKLSQVMLRVSFPVFSRARDMDELLRLRLRIVRTHATIIVPLLAGFVAVAPTLVPWLFGPSWEPAVVPAQIMAVAGMADAVTTGIGPLMITLGRPRLLLAWNIAELAVYATMIALLAQYGLTWVSIGVAAFGVTSMVVAQGVVMPRVIDLGIRDFWRDIRAGVVGAAIALPVLVACRIALDETSLPPLSSSCWSGSSELSSTHRPSRRVQRRLGRPPDAARARARLEAAPPRPAGRRSRCPGDVRADAGDPSTASRW